MPSLTPNTYDVAIIGAGAVGSALARELSRYRLDLLVLEAGDDVAVGATRANSGIVHGGYAAQAGTRKAALCLAGNLRFPRLAAELDFPYRRTGSLVLAFDEQDSDTLERLRQNGRDNGVEGLEILGREDTLRRHPRLNPESIRRALFCPGTGIVSPYEYAVAMMENAVANGVELRLDSPVTALERVGDAISIIAGRAGDADEREFRARFVVNAAGTGAGGIASLAGPPPFRVTPRKGQYIVLRRGSAEGLGTVVFQPPTAKGKGILVTPTTWGNLLLGPDAREVQDPADLETDPESLARIVRTARRSVGDFRMKDAIRVFSGNRPAADRGDFIIEWSESMNGLLHLAGIESPGLTSSPAIATEAARLLREAGLGMKEQPGFTANRKAPARPGPLRPAAEAARDASREPGDPERIVCRCEQVKESVVRDAMSRGIPLRSVDAVKRRTRAGMGACQGAFCGPRVRTLVSETAGLPEDAVLGPSRDRNLIREDLDELRRLLDAEAAK